MPIEKYEVLPLFAEPIFRANLAHAITDEQIGYIKGLKMVRNQTSLITEDLYIFNAPQLQGIKGAVQEALDVYAREVMGISQQLYVTQSWANATPPKFGIHGHSHSNSIVSGSLYFCDLPVPVARMVFERHKTYRQLEINPDEDKLSIFNSPVNFVMPRKYDVLLFPSDLSHLVEANGANEARYSVAFNTFIKGKFGSYRDVSELAL